MKYLLPYQGSTDELEFVLSFRMNARTWSVNCLVKTRVNFDPVDGFTATDLLLVNRAVSGDTVLKGPAWKDSLEAAGLSEEFEKAVTHFLDLLDHAEQMEPAEA
jgi:hypothetical protein